MPVFDKKTARLEIFSEKYKKVTKISTKDIRQKKKKNCLKQELF